MNTQVYMLTAWIMQHADEEEALMQDSSGGVEQPTCLQTQDHGKFSAVGHMPAMFTGGTDTWW